MPPYEKVNTMVPPSVTSEQIVSVKFAGSFTRYNSHLLAGIGSLSMMYTNNKDIKNAFSPASGMW